MDINNEIIVSTHHQHSYPPQHPSSVPGSSVVLSNKSTSTTTTNIAITNPNSSNSSSTRDRYVNFMDMITSTFPPLRV